MATIAGNQVSSSIGSAIRGTVLYQPFADIPFNIVLSGTFVGTAVIVRSQDLGVSWTAVAKPDLSGVASFTVPLNFEGVEPDASVLWTVSMLAADGGAYTSGTLNYRIG